VHKAPGPEERRHLVEIAHEETEHWYGTIKVLDTVHATLQEKHDYFGSQWFYTIAHILIPRYQWVDILMMTFLIDGGAFLIVEDFAQSSYAPWARFAKEVLAEEVNHMDFGNDFVHAQVEKLGPKKVQPALNKWWRVALNMFGPPTTRHTEQYIRLGLKFRSNEDRRRTFVRSAEKQIRDLGLRVPKLYRQQYPFI
jgi:ring-1,2-phenylacetyl-CoA epoxidase subunit PaaA